MLFSHSVVSDSATAGAAVHQASLSFTISCSLLKLMSTGLVMPSNHLILFIPFSSYLQSFPASGSFLISWLFTSGGQSIEVSASSVLPVNIQDWFPLGWTGLISLLSKDTQEDSWVFSNITAQKHQFFGTQLSLQFKSYILTWLLEKP